MAYAIASTTRNGQAGVLYSDGSFVPTPNNSSTNVGGGQVIQRGGSQGGDVLGTSIGPNGGNGGSSNPTGSVNNVVPSAPSGPSSLDLIKARLDETRRQASEQVQNALNAKNELMSFLDTNYGNLETTANNRQASSLDTLAQEGVSTNNAYQTAQGDQRRRAANQETVNRNRARSLNRLDSSFYDSAQAGNTADLTRALGVLGTEQAGKTAALNTRTTDTKNYFTDILNNLGLEKTQYQKQAIDQYNLAQQQGDALNRAGVLDFGQSIDQVNQGTSNRLDTILSTLGQLGLARTQAAASVAAQGGSINNFNAINDHLAGVLGNNTGLSSVLSRALPSLGGVTSGQIDPNTLTQLLALTGNKKPDPNALLFGG